MGRSCVPGALNVGWTPSMWWRHSSRTGKAAQALRDFEQLAWQFAPYCIYKHWGNLNASPWCFRSSHPQQNRSAGRSYTDLPHLPDNLLKIEKKKRYHINLRGISIPHGVQIPSQTAHLTTKPRTPPGGAGVCEVTHQPMTPAARHACAAACQWTAGSSRRRRRAWRVPRRVQDTRVVSPRWQGCTDALRCPPSTAEKSMGFLSGATQKKGQHDAPTVLVREMRQGWRDFSDIS